VISRRAIADAKRRHPICAAWLERWWQTATKAEWTCLEDVRQAFPSADQVGERLVFNATAGRRLIVGVSYASERGNGALFVKALLTHSEYDKNRWRN
jgi:mRNA interferase HigB